MISKMQVVQKNSGNKHLAKKKAAEKRSTHSAQRWSARVTQTSDALDLKQHLFSSDDPSKIAQSLKRSAERSKRRKGTPYQSAMSMLTFYINRAGKNLTTRKRRTLNRAKGELRKAFGRAA